MATFSNLSNVTAFPSTKATSINKLITENSLTRLINRLLDNESFVITNSLSEKVITKDVPVGLWNSHPFEFVMWGYYFSIPTIGDIVSSVEESLSEEGDCIWARIYINTDYEGYDELMGQYTFEQSTQSFVDFENGSIDFDNPSVVGNLISANLFNSSDTLIGVAKIKNGKIYATLNSSYTDSDVAKMVYKYRTGFLPLQLIKGQIDTPPEATDESIPSGDGIDFANNYKIVHLPLVCYHKDSLYFDDGEYVPFNALNRFGTNAISRLDGGEVIYI